MWIVQGFIQPQERTRMQDATNGCFEKLPCIHCIELWFLIYIYIYIDERDKQCQGTKMYKNA